MVLNTVIKCEQCGFILGNLQTMDKVSMRFSVVIQCPNPRCNHIQGIHASPDLDKLMTTILHRREFPLANINTEEKLGEEEG